MKRAMRPAVTLLITLSVIASMLALVGVLFQYLDTVRTKSSAKSALIEANLLANSFVKLINQNIGKRPKVDILKQLYAIPLVIKMQDGDMRASIQCVPIANRINIAWLTKDGDKNMQRHYEVAMNMLEYLLERADVQDKEQFISMLMDALAGNSKRFNISINIREKKGIITKPQFERIVSDYAFANDDKSIMSINWEEYFMFGYSAEEIKVLDAEFATDGVLAHLLQVDLSVVKDTFIPGSLNKFLSDIGIEESEYKWLFAKNGVYAMACGSQFVYQEHQYAIAFELYRGHMKGFEFAQNRQ